MKKNFIFGNTLKSIGETKSLRVETSLDNDYVLMQEKKEHSILPQPGLGTVLEQISNRPMPLVENKEYAPVALRTEMFNASPVFMDSSPGSVTITHREMIQAVGGSAGTDTFPLNFRIQPCNPVTFPWLHAIANLFETYTFTKLKFIYVPRVPTSYAGQIGLAIDFDADDTPATTMSDFASYKNNVIGSIWSGVAIGVEGDALQKCVVERYTDHNISAHTYDPLLHDVGNLRIGIFSPTDNSVVGQIYVEYTIILRTPEPPTHDTEKKTIVKIDAQPSVHFDHPFGDTKANVPILTYYYNDVPIEMVYTSDNRWEIAIKEAGDYIIGLRNELEGSGANWDTQAKAEANLKTTYNLASTGITMPGSSFPFGDGPNLGCTSCWADAKTANNHYCDTYSMYRVLYPMATTKCTLTLAAGAGYAATNTIIMSWFYIQKINVFWPAPPMLHDDDFQVAMKPKNALALRYPTLTPQQRSHPLSGIWDDAWNELKSLATPAGRFLYNRYLGGKKMTRKKVKKLSSMHKTKKKKSKK